MKKALMNSRTFFALLHDIVVSVIAWAAAYFLRFNFSIPAEYAQQMTQSLVWVVLLQGAVFVSFGLYRGVWRFASVSDLKRILFSVGLAAILVAAVLFMLQTAISVPRSVLILDPLLLILMMGGAVLHTVPGRSINFMV